MHKVKLSQHSKSVFDYSHADWDGLLTPRFYFIFGDTDVDALWQYLKDLLQLVLNHFVPKVTLRPH